MDFKISSYCFSILLLACTIDANGTSSDDETRQPRGSRRIVKLYSGVRPEVVCTNEGFKGDPNNCSVFYRCTKSGKGKFTAFRFQCPPGTVYDPETEVCNHPRSTKRSGCGELQQPASPQYEFNEINEVQELPSPITTKAPFYNTLLTPKAPNQALTQNQTIHHWQTTSSTFQNSTTFRPVPSSTRRQEISSYPWVSTTQRHGSVTPSVSPVSQQKTHEEICASDGFMGDSVNCHKFYRCVGNQRNGFTKYEFFCSEPTIWDDDIKSCNHPWAVKRSRCGRSNSLGDTNAATELSITPEQSTSSIVPVATTFNVFSDVTNSVNSVTSNNINQSDKTIQNQLQISYGTNVYQSQTQISNNSVIQNQTQINYGDRVNNTEKVKHKQNQNQISQGPTVSQSQTQISYGNVVVQTQVQIDHTKQSSQSQVQIIELTTPISKSTSAHDDNFTQNKQNVNNTCLQNGFMGDSNDCKKFYRCVDNGRGGFTRHDFSCGEGTLWDQTIEACNHAWAVKVCGGMSSNQKTTTKLPLSSSVHSYATTFNKPNENYYPTTEITHLHGFDDVGYNNDHDISSSVVVTKPTTEIEYQSDTKCNSSGFVGDAKDCQIFYSCVENGKGGYTKYEFKCGEGTLWDADIGTCNHAWAVKRCGGKTTLSTTTKTTLIEPISTSTSKVTTSIYSTSSISHITTQNDNYDTGYGSQSDQPSSTIKSTILPPDPNIVTECQSSGLMGDKNDCKKFYRCVDNGNGMFARYEFTCSEGTVWDSKIEGCNHAWAVNCKNNGIETSTTEVTTQKKPIIIHEETDGGYNIPDSDKHSDVSTQRTTLSTSSMKTTDSVNMNKCEKSGFMGDIMDCKKFYKCVDNGDGSFIRYEFTCGEGTVWDPKIESCNHEWAVEKCGSNYEADHEVATTPSYNAIISDEEPLHGYPSPGYPINEQEGTDKTTQRTTRIPTSILPSAYCKKDGFVGDIMDCKRFYRCVNDGRGGFIKYEFQCGEGTLWDQSIEACNHAWAVKECGAVNETTHSTNETTTETLIISSSQHEYQSTEKTSSTTDSIYHNEITEDCKKEGFAGDPRDCKKFYRCVFNSYGGFSKYTFTCGEGTYWNQIIQACDHTFAENPCKGNGNDMITKEPQHENNETYVETTTKIITTLTTESLQNASISSIEKPESIGTICQSEGFYRDQYDCEKFYRCVNDGKGNYTKYYFTCKKGTIWDQKLTTCTKKSKSNECLPHLMENSTQSNEPTNENEISYISSMTTISHQTSTEKPNVPQQTSSENILSTPYKCTSEGFHANPKDCRKFIRCVNNGDGTFTKYDFACGEGTVWVQDLLACDHDDSTASCHVQSEWTTRPQINFESSTNSNTVSGSTATQSESTNKDDSDHHSEITKVPHIMHEDCQSEGFYADKDDCQKYYRCVSNNSHGYTKYNFICGEGTAWDAKLQTCNYNSTINNCKRNDQSENQTESVVHDEISETTESSTTSATQPPTTESKENTDTESEDTCKNEGFFGNTKDCRKFYRCVDNGKGSFTKYDFTCGDGTIWDQDLQTCNHPHDVANPSCEQGHGEQSENTSSSSGTSSTSTTTTQSSQSTTTQSSGSTTTQSSGSTTTQSMTSITTATDNSSNCTQGEPSKNPGNKNVTCTKAGYYPDPNDCKKFYRCVDWDGNGERFSVYFFECGEGTIWDPALDTCNHEESVYPQRDCSNTQPQNTSSGEQPTTTEPSNTQETTTDEKTTTVSSISENTTTQEPTTSEKTTTEQTITSEPTTTQQSTSNETTTTENSTTTESSTTLSPSTETTTQSVDNTTEQTTTTAAVTEPATTEKTTTQESTTSRNTTEESTTIESTTQHSTTEREGTTTDPTNSSTTDSTLSTTTMTTPEQTSTTENQQETSTQNSLSPSSCPDTDDDQYLFVCPTSFRRHPKYCNLFYQCTEDDENHEVKVAVFNCPNNTIYDESKVQCVDENKADKKCDGEIASRRRVKRLGANYKEPIVVTRDAQKCSTVGHIPFEKNSECSPAFLKCEKMSSGRLRGFVHRCPQNYLYWSISRRCEREEIIRDCKRTINNWSGRWEIPIDRHNVAW